VVVEFIEGDIDRPVITGGVYNGVDAPPFAAGENSSANHPGFISGWHSQSLDGDGYNQWVMDDTTAQMRMRLNSSYTSAELSLGYLINQSAGTAQRGSARGQGFEANTQGWVSLRGAQGLLLSATARAGTYGSAQSTQLDPEESVAQLKGATNLGQRLSEAATQSKAQTLRTHQSGQSVAKFIEQIDVKKAGKAPATVNGQAATYHPSGHRDGTEPVHAFASPVMVLDSPSSIALTSPEQIVSFAGQSISLISQGDIQHTAALTASSVTGKNASFYAADNGVSIIAAKGPVSTRAHTDTLELWADKDVTIISVNDEIRIQAKTKIELIAGQSSITLEGGNITFACPGTWASKGIAQSFLGGASEAAQLEALPVATLTKPVNDIELHYHYDDLSPVVRAPYKITFSSGSIRQGSLDANGYALVAAVPNETYTVEYGEDARDWEPPALPQDDAEFKKPTVQTQGRDWIEKMLANEPAPRQEP
jgi:type VI secretion system secreted protein VgrG